MRVVTQEKKNSTAVNANIFNILANVLNVVLVNRIICIKLYDKNEVTAIDSFLAHFC